MDGTNTPIWQGSLFEAVRRQAADQLTLVPLARETLVHLTRTLEDLVLNRELASLVCTGLGEEVTLPPLSRRLERLAVPSAYVLAFVENSAAINGISGVTPVVLPPGSPLLQERFFLVLSYTFSALLCARPREGLFAGPGAASHDAFWSFDPQIVEIGLAALQSMLESVSDREALQRVIAVRQVLAPRSTDYRALAHFATEMIRFEERLHQELARVERERTHVYDREALLSTIARAFIDLPSDQLDIALEAALLAVGQFAGVDRCLLFERRQLNDALELSYQWHRPGLVPLSLRQPADLPDLLHPDSGVRRDLFIGDLDQSPESESLLNILRAQGVRGFAGVPMIYRETLQGVLALASQTPHQWTEDDHTLLETLMEILVAALEHRRVERALGETESLLERVIYSTNHLVYVYAVMQSGEIEQMFSSPNIEHMLGYPAALKLANWQFWISLIHPPDLPAAELQLEKLRKGEDSEVEYRVTHADGRVLWVRDSARCEPGTGDVRWICYGLISDINDRKAIDQIIRDGERLQIALEAERKVGEVRNRFMLVVSHEFRTPLSVILTSAEMLDRYYDRLTPEKRRERLGIIRAQVQHLRSMLDEISVVIRAELGRLEYQPAPMNAVAFARQIASEMAESVGVMHRIIVSADPDPLHALLDETLLRHALTNLLSNAIKYSEPQAMIHLRVALDTLSRPSAVVIEVEDEGIGIDPEDMQHLFEPFFRGRNASAISGTGLGLKVVRDCLVRHGGTVTAHSAPGQGSCFTLRIPYEPAPRPEPVSLP